jgi:hypothetical protein
MMNVSLFKPKWLQEWREIFKKEGFKGLAKQKGKKILIAFVLIYFIRDVILYIILPFLVVKGFMSC